MDKLAQKVVARFCISGIIQEDDREFVTNAILLLLVKFLLMQADVFFYVCSVFPLPFIFLLSPAESPNKPLNAKEKKVYKLIAVCLCLTLAMLSVVVYRWASRPIGLAICMGLVIESFVLVLALVERLLRVRTTRASKLLSKDVE